MPNLWEDNQPLINISTEEKARTDFTESFKTRYDRGNVGMNEFFTHIVEKIKKNRAIPDFQLTNLISGYFREKASF